MLTKVKKRDGSIVDFEEEKITNAIFGAAKAVGGKDKDRSVELTKIVVKRLEEKYSDEHLPTIEQIQDIVEEVLIKQGHVKTARAYILYRKSHTDLRQMSSMLGNFDLMENYLNQLDWRVKENANMTYSLQGMNFHISSQLVAKYWLNRLYPTKIANAHTLGDFHVHDLGTLAAYCVGWDLQDLLTVGFKGVGGKVASRPAKHFRAALGQIVNFFYTLQGEAAGAQAFSNFDTYLAPFIRADNMSYKEVRQAMQEFIYNINVPTRVGFQCVSEDTEILTPEGWKTYDEVSKDDIIKTFNLKKKQIENQKVTSVFKKKYRGEMYNLKNRIQDQLISPEHRIVRKLFNSDDFVLEPIEEVAKLKSPFIIPIAGENKNKKANISDNQIKLMAWIISKGSIERPGKHRGCYRISIYQSEKKNKKNYNEIKKLLKNFNLKFSEYEATGFGEPVKRMRLNAKSSKKIHNWFGTKESIKFIPNNLLNLNQEQSKLFLDTYLKADGFEDCKIATANRGILDSLQVMAVNAGYGFTTLARKPTIGTKDIFVLRLIKHSETYIQKIKKVNYKGVIWCPHTKNETIIARRKGKVFITGNTPFTNITMDLRPPKFLANNPVIIGGKTMDSTYGDYQKEMDMINQAFAEIMIEGDANGRPFTFPIPTYNITKEFVWDDERDDIIWEMTGKYGIPYFANFINSDMQPDDVRSMCCRLRIDNRELRRRGGSLFGANPLTGCYDKETEILTEEGWKFFKDLSKKDSVFTLTKNNEVELHKPKKIFKYDYEDEMYEFKTKSLDLLVTPNHRMLVDQIGSNKRKFVEAKDFDFNNQRIPKQGIWKGEEKEEFVVPGIEFTKYGKQGRTPYLVIRDSLRIKMDDWLKFFGFWLAEGCVDNEKIAQRHGYRVVITQVKKKRREEIKKVLDNLPFSYYGEKNNFIICNKQLWTYLKQFGKRDEKFIPKELKQLSKRQLKILFDWMVKGDGHVRKTTGQINYWTSSKKLADDLQEVVMKLGWLGTLTSNKSRVSMIKGRKVKSGIIYTLGVQKAKHYRLRKSNIKTINYKGKVYCCEVKNNSIFVRRNGKVSWCGNSIGVVTINMPKIGYLAKSEDRYFEKLEYLMDLAKESLELKRKIIENFTDKGLYPYSKFYLREVKKASGSYWNNHFSTIGLIGMNESLINFMDKDIITPEGHAFAVKVMDFMRKKLLEYQDETGNVFNLEATPGEGTAYRLARIDKKNYPNIKVANEEHYKKEDAKPYYTNSTLPPVGWNADLFEVLNNQDPLQKRYTGGTVFHAFLGEKIDGAAAKAIVKKVFEKYELPYMSITPTFSICPIHGYIAGEHFYCPVCDNELEKSDQVPLEVNV